MRRGWLLCPSFFILLAFHAELIFPFRWFSSMPFIPLVLVPSRLGVCPQNSHQMSYPNLSSSRGISILDHFMDFNSSEITLAACLTTLDLHPPTRIILSYWFFLKNIWRENGKLLMIFCVFAIFISKKKLLHLCCINYKNDKLLTFFFSFPFFFQKKKLKTGQ